MVDRILALPEGTRLYLLAPVVRGRKGEYRKELADFMKRGYQRVKIDGKFYEIAEAPALDKKFKHDIDVVVDRVVVRPDVAARLADSLEQCLKLADGLAVAELADSGPANEDKKGAKIHDQSGPQRLIFSERFACPVSGFTIPEIEPRLFSFNNPFGACPKCGGLGVEQHIDADLVIPDKNATLRRGAIAPWARSTSPYYTQTLEALAKNYRFTLDTKWKDLSKKAQDAILYGSGDDTIRFVYDDGMRSYETRKTFEGVIRNLERRSARPRANGRGKISQNISPTFRARRARATASSRRRCASRSGRSISAKWRRCRSSALSNGSASCRSTSPPSRTRSPFGC